MMFLTELTVEQIVDILQHDEVESITSGVKCWSEEKVGGILTDERYAEVGVMPIKVVEAISVMVESDLLSSVEFTRRERAEFMFALVKG